MSVESMSHESGKNSYSAIEIFTSDDSNSIARAEKLLAGFPHGADKAIGSTIKRAAISGEAYAARAIRDFYYVKASDFKEYTKSKRHITTENGMTCVSIDFRGYHIPLLKFNTKVGRDGRVIAKVERSSTAAVLNHVFKQQIGGHLGLYERISTKRYPVEEKFGPTTTQMMYSNEDVLDAITDKIKDTFDKRIEHEILAVMNGWRL